MNKKFDFTYLGIHMKAKLQHGQSIRDVSRLIGISYPTFYRALAGKEIKVAPLVRVLGWLDMQFEYFITDVPFTTEYKH